MINMRQVNCPSCNSNEFKLECYAQDHRLDTPRDNFSLVKCSKCGFSYVNHIPENIGDYYPKDYYRPYSHFFDKLLAPISSRMFSNIIKEIKKIKGDKAKLLEIGCGTGYFLRKLHDAGYDVTGIDCSENILSQVPNNLRSKIIIGDLIEQKLKDSSFDVVVMKQVFEHIPNIGEYADEIRRILKPGGIVYLEMPNYGAFEATLFGKYWYNLEIPRHLHQFTLHTFNYFFKKHGFETAKILKNNGVCWMKSPFALFHSFRFYMANRFRINKHIRDIMVAFMFFPLVGFTLMNRVISFHKPGMDIRAILRKKEKNVNEESLQRRKRARIPIQDAQAAFLKHILKKKRPKLALEIGCGEGYFSDIAKDYVNNLVASDITNIIAPSVLKEKNVSFVIADATKLSFSDNKFDFVYSFDVLEHVKEDDMFIRENFRVLKEGGTLVIVTPNRKRLTRRILSLFGRKSKFPLYLGTDAALGDIVHVREYTKKDIIKLIKRNNLEYDRLEIKGDFLEIYPDIAFRKFPSFLEGAAKYWFILIQKKSS